MRVGSRHPAVGLALALLGGTAVDAHRLDEYLQAARIDIAANAVTVDLDLTPGTAAADAVVARIDRDHDGALSGDEQRTYVDEVMQALDLRLDDAPLALHVASFTVPTPDALRRGDEAIRLHLEAVVATITTGPHRLRFSNGHLPAESVYLANALVPSDASIAVTDQVREGRQREVTIHFVRAASTAGLSAPWLAVAASGVLWLGRFWQNRASRLV